VKRGPGIMSAWRAIVWIWVVLLSVAIAGSPTTARDLALVIGNADYQG
jgi:hypothetical protein